MAKTDKVSPADAVKAQIEAAKMTAPVDELEKAANEPDTVEIDEADLDAADAAEDYEPAKAEFDLSEGKPSEDPAIVEARKAAFERAAAFEMQREVSRARKAAMLAGQQPKVDIPESHVGGSGDIPEVFYRFGTAFPHTTPDEHIMCGYGSIKLTVGDFRRLVGLPTRT